MVWSYFLKDNRETFSIFEVWKTIIEKQSRKKVTRLRADHGLEGCHGVFEISCRTVGIVYRCIDVMKLQQLKGTSKCSVEILCDIAQSILSHSGLGQEF